MSMTMIFAQRLTASPCHMGSMMSHAISATSPLAPVMTPPNLPVPAFSAGGLLMAALTIRTPKKSCSSVIVGAATMPAITSSSKRYKPWLIHSGLPFALPITRLIRPSTTLSSTVFSPMSRALVRGSSSKPLNCPSLYGQDHNQTGLNRFYFDSRSGFCNQAQGCR